MLLNSYKLPNCAKRSTLHSDDNEERLAIESFRLKQMTMLNKTDYAYPREFTSYFQSSPNTSDPNYVASHTFPVPVPRKKKEIPPYSMMEPLRWNSSGVTSSAEDVRTNRGETEPAFGCRCSCSKNKCPSKVSSSTTMKSCSRKKNIMTFADKCIMTVNLEDVCCGLTPAPSKVSLPRVMATPPKIAVKDTRARTYIEQRPTQSKRLLAPILKNSQNMLSNNYDNCAGSHYCAGYENPCKKTIQIAEKDKENDHRLSVCSVESFYRNHDIEREPTLEDERRLIYNEGISDLQMKYCPATCMKVASPPTLGGHFSRSTLSKAPRGEDEGRSPYSHRTDSRYHQSCKRSYTNLNHYDNEPTIPASPGTSRKTGSSKPVHNKPPIKLPKKVLTSERDIDAFIDLQYTKTLPASRRRRWS